MNTQLTSEEVGFYKQNGFLKHTGLLSPAEVAELKGAVLDAVASMGNKRLLGGGEKWDDKDSYYDKVFTQRLNLWRFNETVRRYMLHPEVGRMVWQLEGGEGFRMWHDQALIKEPFGNPTGWHLDNPYWSFHSRHAISIWIALEDATLENGCMWFSPGSNKLANFENSGIGPNLADLFKVYPGMGDIDPVSVPMKAGDCSFHNGLTAHGAGANMTRRRRIAMTAGYMPIGSTFNGQRNILPESYFKSLQKGDVLANDEWNPIVHAATASVV